MAEWVLAVDFGTCFSSGALSWGDCDGPSDRDDRVEVVEVGSSRYVPSVVVIEQDGSLVTGRAAAERAVVFPERAVRLPKRALVEGPVTLVAGATAETADLVAAVLKVIAGEAVRRRNGQPPVEVVLTHPAVWQEPEQARLAEAGARAGLPGVELMAEPVAAARFYAAGGDSGETLSAGARVAVFDLGGGTLDTAVLERTADGFALAGPPGGDPHLGGEDLDELLREVVAGHARGMDGGQAWDELWAGPDRLARRDQGLLLGEITRAKETLSGELTALVYVPGYEQEIRITRAEFTQAARPLLSRAVRELARTLDQAGAVPGDLAGIYLTGGSSRIPLVAELIADSFGCLPRTLDDPKTVVAVGALTRLPAPPRSAQAATAPAATAPAVMFRGGSDHTGTYSPGAPPVGWTPWKQHIPTPRYTERLAPSPTVAGNLVYVGSRDRALYALDALTGERRWEFETGSSIYSTPAVADGIVYVGSRDRRLYALDARTGRRRWDYATTDRIYSSPAVAGGLVYVGCEDGNLYALDAASGELRWRQGSEWNAYFWSSPAVADGVVYFAGCQLRALDALTGELRWADDLPEDLSSSPAVAAGTVFIGSSDHHLYAVDAASGQRRWEHKTGDALYSSPAVADGVVYVGSGDGRLYALDAVTGQRRWDSDTRHWINASPVVAGGIVYISSHERLFALDAVTGEPRWEYGAGDDDEFFSSPTVTGGIVYVSGFRDCVYAIDAVTGKGP